MNIDLFKKTLLLLSMKNIFLIALSLLFITACNQKFKVGAPYKEVTAVYGLLSKSDTVQYIKVMKGFYDETQSNLKIAQDIDSIYYKNLELTLEVLSNGNVIKTDTLILVDLNHEGYQKDTGVFANKPNYGYKLKDSLDATKKYHLKIRNLASGSLIEGETDIINTKEMIFQKPYINTVPLNFQIPVESSTFQWAGPSTAAFYDLALRFWYEEVNTNTNITQYKYVDLPLIQNVIASGDGSTQALMSNEQFYRALVSELGTAPNYISRRVDTPDLILLAGGAELKTYIDASVAQGGITADQIKPNYTNLRGKDVLGVFSTRGKKFMYNIPFNLKTEDSIIHSVKTKSLNIVGRSLR